MKGRGVLLVLAVAALWPATGNAAGMRGVVVARSHGTLLVATPSGAVQAVRGNAAIGARLAGTRVVGHATQVRLHGIVVERVGTTLFLSSNRHLLAIHRARGLADHGSHGSGGVPVTQAPAPGSVVDTTVGVRPNGELDEEDEAQVGQVAAGNLQIQATVTAVGAGTVTLSVDGQTVTMSLPNGLTLPAAVVGQTVTLTVSLNGTGEDQGDDHGDGGGDG
ncbi:MAG: hypothetical protein ABUS54_13290 [Actinomycetota bacterium]